jgi:hypothetical protein
VVGWNGGGDEVMPSSGALGKQSTFPPFAKNAEGGAPEICH